MTDQRRRPGTRNPSRGGAAGLYTGTGSSRSLTTTPENFRVTRDHDVIRRWAEQRGARPATMPGSIHNGRMGVLRLDFPGYGGAVLQPVAWDDWLATFDARGLAFRFQERRRDGRRSNVFRLERTDRG